MFRGVGVARAVAVLAVVLLVSVHLPPASAAGSSVPCETFDRGLEPYRYGAIRVDPPGGGAPSIEKTTNGGDKAQALGFEVLDREMEISVYGFGPIEWELIAASGSAYGTVIKEGSFEEPVAEMAFVNGLLPSTRVCFVVRPASDDADHFHTFTFETAPEVPGVELPRPWILDRDCRTIHTYGGNPDVLNQELTVCT